MHALVIEDEPLTALDIRDALERMGFASVEVAFDSRQAVAAAHRHAPDLIIADVRLGDGKLGPEVVLQISRAGLAAVVYVTGVPALIQGYPGVIVVPKPVDEVTLRGAVDRALAGAKFLRPPSFGRVGSANQGGAQSATA